MLRYARKISVGELRPGMFVEALDRPWLDTDYPLQGVEVRSQADIERLQQLAEHVYIAVDARDDADPAAAQDDDPAPRGPTAETLLETRGAVGQGTVLRSPYDRSPQAFRQELGQARLIRGETKRFVEYMQAEIGAGRPIDSDEARELVVRIMASLSRNRDALLWFTNLKNRDEYTAVHSLNVCLLAVSLATSLGESEQDIREIGVGALLHDVGKIRVPTNLLTKPERLSDDEFAEMKRHPEYGFEILHAGSHMSPRSLSVVLEHHERLNGRGYPYGLKGSQISHYGQLVAIADVYDAVTSDRVYQRGRSPADAVELMLASRGDFNKKLLQRFVDSMGAYPVGSVIELNTGEVGFVLPGDRSQPRPLILVVLDHKKRRYFPQRVRDLNRFPRFKIRRLLATGAYGVDVADYAEELE